MPQQSAGPGLHGRVAHPRACHRLGPAVSHAPQGVRGGVRGLQVVLLSGGPGMEIRPFAPADEAAVIALWERCGLTRPWNDPAKDIRRKLAVQPDLFLVGVTDGAV